MLLAVCLAAGILIAPAFAADAGKLELSAPTEAAVGEEFTVDLKLAENPGIASVAGYILFDHDKLQLIKVEDTGNFPGQYFSPNIVTDEKPMVVYTNPLLTTNNTYTGKITSLTFKVKKGTAGSVTIAVEPIAGNCIDVKPVSVPFTGNTVTVTVTHEHQWGTWTTTKEATCTEAGEEARVCSICGLEETQAISPLGHDWDEGTVTKEPACTEDGVMTYTCKRDPSHVKTEAIKALGHEAEWTVTKEATCTEKGTRTGHCTRCDQDITEEIAALGHDWDEGKVTKASTATSPGEKTYTCKRCGETRVEAIPALGSDGNAGKDGKATPGDNSKTPGTKGDLTGSKSGRVKTGDTALVMLYSGIFLAALAAAGGMAVYKRRKVQ